MTRFRDLPTGSAFSFATDRNWRSADPDGYVKVSARVWQHPTYGRGRVGSINVEVLPACPFDAADASECSMTRERSVAGRSDIIPFCPVHGAFIEWTCEGFNDRGRWVDCDRTEPHGHGIMADFAHPSHDCDCASQDEHEAILVAERHVAYHGN